MPTIRIEALDIYDFNATHDKYNDGTQRRIFSKVNAIKSVRTLTGWGLKESKEAVDAAMVNPNNSAIEFELSTVCSLRSIITAKNHLNQTGFIVTEQECVIDLLRRAAKLALTEHNDNLSSSILDIIISLKEDGGC